MTYETDPGVIVALMGSSYAEINAAFPWLYPAFAFVFGAIIGSFLNVCIYRIPAGKSIVRPGSQCACGQPIRWYDNLPILSWFILRGRARCCGRPYSIRYPLVELLTATLFLGCWLLFPPAKAACLWVLISGLICATFIDIDTFEIPDVFSVGLAIVGFCLSLVVPALHGHEHPVFVVASLRSVTDSLQGMFIGAGLVYMVSELAYLILRKEGMGQGDVKLVAAIGAFCGWESVITAIFGGSLLGTVWMIGVKLWQATTGRKVLIKAIEPGDAPQEVKMGASIQFGPYLAAGGILHVLYLHPWVTDYFNNIREILAAQ